MEPDVVRMYSSSPPPLDEDGEEEDEDDFGEFGGYCSGASSSFSFSDYDVPTAFDRSFEADPPPPDLYNTFTQRSVGQPGKEVVLEEPEKITKDQEAPNPESPVCETDVALDSGNGKMETSEVLANGSTEMEISLESVTRKQGTSERQDFELTGKEEQQQKNSRTDQVTHCLCNGPIAPGTESVVVSSTKDFTSENKKAFREELSIDSQQLLEDTTSQTKLPEDMAVEEDTESQEVDSRLTDEDQSNTEEIERKETEEDEPSGHCGPSGASVPELRIQTGSEDLEGAAETSLTPAENVSMSDTQENVEGCTATPVSPAFEGPPVVSGTVELGENFEKARLAGMERAAEADSVIRDVQSVVLGSSVESDEDFGGFRDATRGLADVSQTESVSQEEFADFGTALSDHSSHDELADADTPRDSKEEVDLAPQDDDDDDDHHNNVHVPCSELPPSDSFADFSSAPFGDPACTASESWAEFGQQQQEVGEERQESWVAFEEEQQSSAPTAPSNGSFQADNGLFGLSHKLQHLFERTFPSEKSTEDSAVPTLLETLLGPRDHAEIRESIAMLRHLLDIHNTHGLKVQWVGSHSNRILLDCLGICNVLFTGQNKQPVIVPVFAAGLGMLEPTKEPVKPSSICSTSSPRLQGSTPCTRQVASLSSLEDDAPGGAVTQLNLDFFGPVEDCSSDTDTVTPMPGVDPELYELTTAKLEGSNVADAFTRLMETVDKNSTVTRKSQQDGALSEEAARVLSLLPNLSFMHARVLMFPSTLTPTDTQP